MPKYKVINCNKSLRILGDSVTPWNNLFGDSVKKRKTTREFSDPCRKRLNVATVATFNTQNVATLGRF